ncbi:MAG: GNAT family N-acetyltransferase [Gemmataceae bacterium]|nr:GNAT family N-acetyltransferase [Gemmataceae bacterium]
MSTVTLNIDEKLGFQLVYRQERDTPFPVEEREGVKFLFLTKSREVLRHLPALRPLLGWPGVFKALTKVATGRRSLYLVLQEGRAVSTGWCTVGRCRYYQVEPDAVVIGPIWSAKQCRGQGLAPFALQRAVNHLMAQGRRIFYIDTFKTNTASQHVIAKCGFGAPVSVYLR